jgi:2-amino-4-hydroxy-6-hydroxymethyldihydropteridine diphosphokinase
MTVSYLSLGSNIDRHKYIMAALDALTEMFGDLIISSVYESKSVGFNGSNFFNLVVGIKTDLTIGVLSEALKRVEDNNGRLRSGPKFSPRTLDIDILTYGNFVGVNSGVELPRAEIIKNAFVLFPLAEIAPNESHPHLSKTYAELWEVYDKKSQALWAIDFEWHGRKISSAH